MIAYDVCMCKQCGEEQTCKLTELRPLQGETYSNAKRSYIQASRPRAEAASSRRAWVKHCLQQKRSTCWAGLWSDSRLVADAQHAANVPQPILQIDDCGISCFAGWAKHAHINISAHQKMHSEGLQRRFRKSEAKAMEGSDVKSQPA